MKNFVFISLFVIMFSFLFSACNNQPKPVPQKTTTTVASTEVTYSNQGFLVETQMIVKGNTVWGISQQTYGTGLMWREIIALNPFLNDPTRLYYNPENGLWIVRIYPGEILKIKGQQVNPTYTYKETVTTTTTEPVSASVVPIMDWWGWLLIAVIFLLLALLVFSPYFRSGVASAFSNSSSSSNANVRVDVHGNDIDADLLLQERVRTIQRQQYLREDIWNDSRKILKKSAENNRLKNFTAFHDEQGEIFVNANFRRDRRDERRNDSNEERK